MWRSSPQSDSFGLHHTWPLSKLSLPPKASFCERREARWDLISPAEIAMPRYTLRTLGNKPGDTAALHSRELQMWRAQRSTTIIILRNP